MSAIFTDQFWIGWCASASFAAMCDKRLVWSGVFLALGVIIWAYS
jgi:hypothetical protein